MVTPVLLVGRERSFWRAMNGLDLLKLPLYAFSVATTAKSFVGNPLLGSRRLNEWGLHRARVAFADRMATLRRRRLAALLSADDVAACERDGFLVIRDFLPRELFLRAAAEAPAHVAAAREMRQGCAVTRRVTLDPIDRAMLPNCVAAVQDARFERLLRYVAAHDALPMYALQTIVVDPGRGGLDPQTVLHSDTFHATAKAWLFLQDVGEDDGPFVYVPGSHRVDARRLAWEQRQSLLARESENRYHARGSFRFSEADLAELGLGRPRTMAVPANTLVVADTHGIHARTPSQRPTVRMEIYATLRRNPFVPGWGVDLLALPGIRARRATLVDQAADLAARLRLAPAAWPRVSPRRLDSAQVG